MVNTLSDARAVKSNGKRSRVGTSGNYQNTANRNTIATLPGEIGTPQQRLEVLQDEIMLARAAGITINIENVTTKAGRKCVVIVVNDALLDDNCFWHVPLPEGDAA